MKTNIFRIPVWTCLNLSELAYGEGGAGGGLLANGNAVSGNAGAQLCQQSPDIAVS